MCSKKDTSWTKIYKLVASVSNTNANHKLFCHGDIIIHRLYNARKLLGNKKALIAHLILISQ